MALSGVLLVAMVLYCIDITLTLVKTQNFTKAP